jgi:flagellar biosynthesis/type III secretory pathway protein FliH
MTKVIKRDSVDLGDISPETGFADSTSRRAPVIKGETADARSEAQTIRERALAEAERIRNEAEEEAVRLKEEACKDGYAKGRDQGAAELAEVVAKASMRLQQIEAQLVPQMRDLAVTIAKKILGRELEFHPDGVVDIVKQALSEKARQRREIYLRVHPEDLRTIREHKPELLEVLSRAKEIGLREDPEVQRYGVIIETDAGTIDAQLETQLAVFERVLKEVR